MDIFDKTAELAVWIRQSKEYRRFMETRNMLSSRPQTLGLLKQYREIQFALQLAEISGDEDDESEFALEALCTIMGDDPTINAYLTAEYNLTRLMQDIQRILTEDIEIFLDYDTEENNLFLN